MAEQQVTVSRVKTSLKHKVSALTRWTHLGAATLFITGCTSMCGVGHEKMSPEQVVEAYLDVALNMKDPKERDSLVQFTTGNLKNAIEAASPETIKKAYVDRRYQLINYSVVERRDRTPRETEITFQLTYNDLGADGKAATESPKVTTENTVAVVKDKGLWLIRDVLGHKTAIDFPVSKDSEITARPGPGTDDSGPLEIEEEPAPVVDEGLEAEPAPQP